MDQTTILAIKTAAFTLLGIGWQMLRAQSWMPNWGAGAVITVVCFGAWVWATPSWLQMDWRMALLDVYGFVMGARGAAASGKDAKVLPPTVN